MSYCTNLSRGGLFVCTPDPLDIGERITLSFAVPGRDQPLRIAGQVRWVRGEDGAEGPAGMGLRFDDVDGVLGHHVDYLVESFAPLAIEIVGDPGQAWEHIAALARSIVACEAKHHSTSRDLAPKLAAADLIIVDVDANPSEALALLAALAALAPRPPTLALCAARAVELRGQAARYARVVPTPVDSTELQGSVLQTLSQVRLAAQR